MNCLWSRKLLSLGITVRSSMATFSPVTHVIFDLDGTILDSEILYTASYKTVFESYGKTYDDKLRLKITGTKESDSLRILMEHLGNTAKVEDFTKKLHVLHKKMLPNTTLKPGAERLIRHLYDNKIPLAVATSSGEENCKLKLVNYKPLFECFHHIVMGSSDPEVVNGKPAPDIFLITANRFPVPPKPQQCLVFEDAYAGVVSGKAAGMQVVMIPEDYVPEELTKSADLVLKSLEDFKPEDFGLPPYPS